VSTDKGYVKVYRDIRNHWLWKDKPFSKGQAWIDLLMMVNHKDKKLVIDNGVYICKRGTTVTSLRKLAEQWGWSTGKTDRFLKLLKSDGMITEKRNSRRTVVTVVNYGAYQQSANTKRDSNETLTEQSRNTDENKQDIIEDTIEDTKKKIDPLAGEIQGDEPTYSDEEGWQDP